MNTEYFLVNKKKKNEAEKFQRFWKIWQEDSLQMLRIYCKKACSSLVDDHLIEEIISENPIFRYCPTTDNMESYYLPLGYKYEGKFFFDACECEEPIRDIAELKEWLFEVEVGTNGYRGGDTGHGSRTYIRIQDGDGTDMQVHSFKNEWGDAGVELLFGGDAELSTLITALKFAVNVLESNIEENRNRTEKGS